MRQSEKWGDTVPPDAGGIDLRRQAENPDTPIETLIALAEDAKKKKNHISLFWLYVC